MKKHDFISIVIPVFNAEGIIPKLVDLLIRELLLITGNFEIILVDDGSHDNSWMEVEKGCKKDPRIHGIKLSRNFGQHFAITAGLDHAQGDWIVVMDCDLQDRPEEIINLYKKALEGYDIVLAKRAMRQDVLMKRFFSFAFYAVLSYLTGVRHDPAIANFGIYHKKVIKAVIKLRESIRYFPTMIRWVGFNSTIVNVKHGAREEGESSYNLKRMLNLAVDIILANSDKPIRLTIKAGISISLLAFIFSFVILASYFLGKIEVLGYTSLILSICFFSGLIIMILGMIGLYIGKTFEETKGRPIYIIDKHL